MANGIYLRKIVVRGVNKQSASIELDKGLNVLSGASNTGKSYVFNCIDFILGAGTSPKDIEEAKGYNEVRAEFCTFDGITFTLSRYFNENVVYLAECSMDDFSRSKTRKLSTTHSSKNDENLSAYLLDILGMKGKKLKKNQLNEKKEVSFRDIARFSLINEEKIISETSPIYTGQHTSQTVEDALFRLILSGKDDDDLETYEDPKIAKSKISGKIEYLKDSVKKKEDSLSELKKEVQKLKSDELNLQIEELTEIVDKANKNVIEEEKNRQKIWDKIEELNSKIIQIRELKKRFASLDKHYESDLRRLDFINEGAQYIEQIKDIDCPICGSLIKKNLLEPYESNAEDIKESLKAEYLKISKKQNELKSTVEDLGKDETELIIQITNEKKKFDEINSYIMSKLKPVYTVNKDKLQSFLDLKKQQNECAWIQEEINRQEREIAYYQQKLQEKEKKASQIVLSDEIYQGLAKDIKDILCTWGLNCKNVYYKKTDNDIEVDGKSRQNFGKGFRAIYLSAFMIAVMKYCIRKDLNHPKFLILDSPLTAYKEKDSVVSGDNIGEEIQNKFYTSINNLEIITKCQIFIIDNKDPPKNINITRIHFSRNEEIGRYGFFPI